MINFQWTQHFWDRLFKWRNRTTESNLLLSTLVAPFEFRNFCVFSSFYRQLSVSFKKGFDTLHSRNPTSEGFSDSQGNSQSVGMLGIEPRLPHPQRGVLPLYYIPKIDILHYSKKLLVLEPNGKDS